jgi:hypothetical protein
MACMQGRKALDVIATMNALRVTGDLFVQAAYKEMKDIISMERANAGVTVFKLCKPKMINRKIIACSIQTRAQLAGVPAMMLYITYVFVKVCSCTHIIAPPVTWLYLLVEAAAVLSTINLCMSIFLFLQETPG